MVIQQRLARNLKKYRKRRGLTQAQLAAKAGFGWSYIARLEIAAHPEVPISTVALLAKALKVKVVELVG